MENNYLKENLLKLRKEKKLSQNKLGEILGVSGAYIQQLEKGVKTNPSIDLIYKIADYFDVAPLNLLERNIDDEFLDFADINEFSNLLRDQAIKKDKLYSTDKYFKQLFIKPSEWEDNSVSTAINVLLNKIDYSVHDFTKDEYAKIEKSIFEYLKTIAFIKDANSK